MIENKPGTVVVITGSSRGIGRGLAEAFLDLGCSVVITGRQPASLQQTFSELCERFGESVLLSKVCDVREDAQLQMLWQDSLQHFGKIDIWINNAGMGLPVRPLWEEDGTSLDLIMDTNLKGVIHGSRVAIRGMREQGFGHLYNMEGFGSDGRIRAGMTAYGTSKAAVAYLTRGLARECRNSKVKVSALSPGMVVTDLLTRDLDPKAPGYEQTIKIFNILADRVETVTPWLARKVLANQTNGGGIRWLGTAKIVYRFASSALLRRRVMPPAQKANSTSDLKSPI